MRAINNKEFISYLVIGVVATAIDWSLFTILVSYFNIYYQTSVCLAVSITTVLHYLANKVFTFNCASKQIASQLSMYSMVAIVSLLGTMVVMYVLVNELMLTKIMARITTTGLMVVPNYLLHKYLTFNKKIFG